MSEQEKSVINEQGLLTNGYYDDPIAITPPTMPKQVWGSNGKGFFAVAESKEKLDPGCYRFEETRAGIFCFPHDMKSDSLIEIDDSDDDGEVKAFFNEASTFFSQENTDRYAAFSMMQRRGYILHGPPGTGKTCTIKRLIQQLTTGNEAICLLFDSANIGIIAASMQILRGVEPKRPVLVVIEDLEHILHRNEQTMLSFLDGEDSCSHMMVVGTTNNFDRIDSKFTKRPRRFDRSIKIDGLPTSIRRKYFKSKLDEAKDKISPEDYAAFDGMIDSMVAKSKNFSFAAMTEMMVNVFVMKKDLNDSAASLKGLLGIQSM